MDDKPEKYVSRSEGGHRSNECIFEPEKLCRPVNPLMYGIKWNSS